MSLSRRRGGQHSEARASEREREGASGRAWEREDRGIGGQFVCRRRGRAKQRTRSLLFNLEPTILEHTTRRQPTSARSISKMMCSGCGHLCTCTHIPVSGNSDQSCPIPKHTFHFFNLSICEIGQLEQAGHPMRHICPKRLLLSDAALLS